MLKATSILSILHGILALGGFALVVLSAGPGNTTDVVIGMGAVVLGVLGLEARSIISTIEKSQRVMK